MKKIIIAIMVVTLVVGGVSVYAIQKDRGIGFGNHCGLSEEQIKILNDKIIADVDEMLEKEEITKEQYEQVIESVKRGRIPTLSNKMPEIKPGKKGNQPEITEEQKAKMLELHKEMLKKQLDNGKITQEEYDELIKKVENGEFVPGRKGPGAGMFNEGFNRRKMPEIKNGEKPEFKDGEIPDFKNMPFRGGKNRPSANEEVTE